ncbi:MAG TPA: MerR family transcriptional regulator, partial [Mycobacterium sp.]|nr:MerR family transcriptional regulator [Mycobacterium sp.]
MRDDTVQIGQAAALYGLAPSTVRWWEKQGVLPPSRQTAGKRRYDRADLRRIGLAYLCAVTGMMPLDQTAIVTSGDSDNETWQCAVHDQITRLDEQCARLQSARAYLAHLLTCTSDDPTSDCPHLEDELRRHTPRGRIDTADIVEAARRSSVAARLD